MSQEHYIARFERKNVRESGHGAATFTCQSRDKAMLWQHSQIVSIFRLVGLYAQIYVATLWVMGRYLADRGRREPSRWPKPLTTLQVEATIAT